jgi:DNA polymerase III alpha subunit (gram-positive type)
MKSNKSVRCAFLAGLFDADGTLAITKLGTCCTITSTSDFILNSVRKLLLIEGIYTHQEQDRIHIWNTYAFAQLVNNYVVLKKVVGKLLHGKKEGWIPRNWFLDYFKSTGMSQRKFMNVHKIDRQHFKKNKLPFIRKYVVANIIPKSEINYVRVKKIEQIANQRFYDLSVSNHHNFIADGIVVHNCYQEQVMQILSIVGKIPLRDCYQVIKAISKKKKEGFEKYKDKFIENGQITLGKSKEEVEKYFDLIESFAGYGFNLAHATSYSYISAKQLYLKAHYPLEFYAATLMCEQDDEKIREYITEAENHGVEVCNLDLNKSKDNFSIQENKIYVGFSNIKGIGEDKAKKIVEMQPYAGFEDFLARFGVEANILRALIPLRVFNELEPEILYKFWIAYSEYTKKCKEKFKRYEAARIKIFQEAQDTIPHIVSSIDDLNDNKLKSVQTTDIAASLVLEKYIKKLASCDKRFENNQLSRPILSSFDCKGIEIEDEATKDQLQDVRIAEGVYFGFIWNNKLKTSPDYKPHKNFEYFDNMVESGVSRSNVMGEIVDLKIKKFKSGKGQFASVLLMDDSFKMGRINVWDDDYAIFKEELKVGNFISIQITPPSNGFSTYSFFSPSKWERYKLPKDKSKDFRLCLLRKE